MKVRVPKSAPGWQSTMLQAAADGRLLDDDCSEYFPPTTPLDAIVCSSGCTCLHWAAGNGHLESVRFLLDHTYQSVNDRAVGISNGRTALHYACRNGHLDVVQCLIETYGADADAHAKDRVTPFQMAVWQCRLPIVRYLVERCCIDPAQVNDFDCGAIHWVGLAPFGRKYHVLAMAKYLHETLELPMTLPQRQNHTALHKAAWGGHLELVRYLHRTLLMWDTVRDTAGYTAAGLAVLAGNQTVARYLRRFASERTYNALAILEIDPMLWLTNNEHDILPQIIRSYRKKVRQCHPDSHQRRNHLDAQELLRRFHSLTGAYKWLMSDSEDNHCSLTHTLPLRLTQYATVGPMLADDSDDFQSRLSVILNEYGDKGLDISNLVKKWRLVWPDTKFPYCRKEMGGRSLKQWLQREYPKIVVLKQEGPTVRLYPRTSPLKD